ncbi:MAG: nucleotidyltransferase domain-containing protein [Nanoarchaeota archaeon]
MIYLFGSQVTGRAREDSDVDIAVILKNPNDKDESFVARFWSDKLDVHCFHKLPLLIQFRIFKYGKVLFVRDKKFLHMLKVNVLGYYLDFADYINDFYRRALKNVR